MPVEKLKSFLNENSAKYVSIRHSPAYTSQEIAASAHVSGKQLAKSVIFKIDGKMTIIVLPANAHVNFHFLQKALGAALVDLASESEFKNKFPDCELGAMPPFGNLYNMPVYVSSLLSDSDVVIFNAGSHSELIQIAYADFIRLVKPKIISME